MAMIHVYVGPFDKIFIIYNIEYPFTWPRQYLWYSSFGVWCHDTGISCPICILQSLRRTFSCQCLLSSLLNNLSSFQYLFLSCDNSRSILWELQYTWPYKHTIQYKTIYKRHCRFIHSTENFTDSCTYDSLHALFLNHQMSILWVFCVRHQNQPLQ